MNDLFVYTYPDVFHFDRFVERMTPLVEECINWGEYEENIQGSDEIQEKADYSAEILDMFIRMGIRKLDGKRNFKFEKEMTYISVPVKRQDGVTDIFSVDVFGAISIEKDGMI